MGMAIGNPKYYFNTLKWLITSDTLWDISSGYFYTFEVLGKMLRVGIATPNIFHLHNR